MTLDRRRSIADQIYEELRRRIVQLELKPGEALSEQAIGAGFQVSRTPVREAVARLAEHGLLSIAPQFGTFVAGIDPDEVRQAQFMRENLEVPVALRLCARGPFDLGAQRALVARQREFLARGDYAGFVPLDDALHASLFALAGVGQLWGIIHAKKAHLDRIRFLQVPEPGKIERIGEQHVAILDAIEAGDAELAERLVRAHTSGALQSLERLLQERPELFETARRQRPRRNADSAEGAGL